LERKQYVSASISKTWVVVSNAFRSARGSPALLGELDFAESDNDFVSRRRQQFILLDE
jgi:hypothetical protein